MSFNSSYPSQRQAQIKEMQEMFDQLLQSGSQRKKKPIFISRNKGSKDKLDMTRSMFENFLKKDQEEHVHEVEESIKSIKENTVRQKESDEELRKMFEIWCELLEEKENEMAHIRKQLDDKEVQSNNLLKQLEIIKKETSDKDVLISQFEVSSRKFRHSMSSVESQLEQCKLLEQKLRKSELTVTSLQQNLELLRKENTRLTFMDSQLRELQKDYKSQIQKNKEYEETLSRHKSRMRISKQREEKYQLSLSQVNDLKQTVVLLQEEMKMENIKSGISDLESKSKECLEEEKKRMKTELDKQTEFAQRNESELRFKIQQLETTCRERLERNKILDTENLHYKSECSQLKIKVTKLEKELILFVQAKGELETISNENAMLNKELLAVQNKIYRNSEAKHFSAQQKGNKVIKIKKMQSSNLSPMTETYKCMSDRLEWAKSEIRKLSTDNSRSVALVAKLQMENQKFTKQILNVKEENTTISSLSYHQEKKESENITEIKSELTRLNRELDHQNASNESLRETILQLKQEIEGYQQQEFQYTRQEGLINEQRWC